MEPIPEKIDAVATAIVDASVAVHSRLGPGLLEKVYESCLAYEIGKRGFPVLRQVGLPLVYDDVQLEVGLRLDLVVANCVIVEIKAIESLAAIHTAQMITYLRLSGIRRGLLINFNVGLIRDGIRRIAV